MAKRANSTPSRKSGAWKKERASVNVPGRARSRSNKYSGGDKSQKPPSGSRQRVWVGGYTRSDGTKVQGHYREIGPGK